MESFKELLEKQGKITEETWQQNIDNTRNAVLSSASKLGKVIDTGETIRAKNKFSDFYAYFVHDSNKDVDMEFIELSYNGRTNIKKPYEAEYFNRDYDSAEHISFETLLEATKWIEKIKRI